MLFSRTRPATILENGARWASSKFNKFITLIFPKNSASHYTDFLSCCLSTKDDAAAFDLGNGTSVLSTTDFFMPIVDDPFTFGKIAATNAISDIYAMGGKPLMAIAIFGWPIDKLDPEVGQLVANSPNLKG